ncbi:MAG: hypothetical protein JXR62_02160 [Bacilli bacterium]|nr:hypothetical protein [Bacilli bacterium]
MKKLLKYDYQYLKRTSKFIIFPVVIIILAVLSPLTARYLNEILAFSLGDQAGMFNFPDPVVFDSYVEYLSNLSDIYLYVIIFIGVGTFINDKTKGLYPLILSKPINRVKYLLSKYMTLSSLIFVSLMVGMLVFSFYTYYIFGEVDLLNVFLLSLLYFIYVELILAIAMFSAMYFKSYITAVMITFAGYILVSLINVFSFEFLKYMPGMISSNIIQVISNSASTPDVIYNVVVTLVITGLLVVLSITKFKKYDLN